MEEKDLERVPIWEKVTLTVREAAAYSSIGVIKLYNLLNEPGCKFVLYIGNRKLVKRKEFEEFLSKSVEL